MRKELRLKLARMLRDAVHDARKLARTPGYKLNMMVMCRTTSGVCEACLGGAYALLHMKAPKRRDYPLMDWTHEMRNAAWTVDALRTGNIISAADRVTAIGTPIPVKDKYTRTAATIIANSFKVERQGGRATWKAYLEAARALEGTLPNG